VVGAFREKWIGRIGISRSCRVHRAFSFLYLTHTPTPCNGRLGAMQQVEAIDLNRPLAVQVNRPYRVAISRANGSSTRQTFSARIFWPAAFG
jgi:hypothetical protein